MKNISIHNLNQGAKCIECNQVGFILYTPEGADKITCPICGHCTNFDNCQSFECIGAEEFGIYCNNCNIIYDISDCVHGVNGCTEDSWYGMLINKWKYKDTIYDGMILFDNFEECASKIKDIQILETLCCCKLTNCASCPKAYYPKKKNKNQYEECECSK